MDLNLDLLKRELENRKPRPVDIENMYAVALPLYFNQDEDRWELIYEVRSERLKRQPLEISFPGGRLEPGETFAQAMVRESMEELRIKRENIDIIGELDYIVTTGTLIIRSFLVEIKGVKFEDIDPSHDEVDHLFTVPLDFFLETKPLESKLYMTVDYSDKFPYELIPNGRKYNFARGQNRVLFYKYEDYIIWGFTAKMTKSLVDLVQGLDL